jgi:hypothetical protein
VLDTIVSYVYYNFMWCGVIILLIIEWSALGFLLICVWSFYDRCRLSLHFTLDMLMVQIRSLVLSLLLPGLYFHLATSLWTPGDSGGIFLDHATKNIAEYEALITLMTNASSLEIRSLVVWLDSELVILHLTSQYSICNPMLY